jgi:hypothetical protein
MWSVLALRVEYVNLYFWVLKFGSSFEPVVDKADKA